MAPFRTNEPNACPPPPEMADCAERAVPIAAYEVVPRDLSRTQVLSGVLGPRQHTRVAAAEHQLWRTPVDHGEIRAPADAVVTDRLIEPGEAVAAQQALFEIAVDDVLMLRVGTSEHDAVQIEPG